MKSPVIWNTLQYLRLRWPELWGVVALVLCQCGARRSQGSSRACMLLKREVFEEIGSFCEEYFMYSENLDLRYQFHPRRAKEPSLRKRHHLALRRYEQFARLANRHEAQIGPAILE